MRVFPFFLGENIYESEIACLLLNMILLTGSKNQAEALGILTLCN